MVCVKFLIALGPRMGFPEHVSSPLGCTAAAAARTTTCACNTATVASLVLSLAYKPIFSLLTLEIKL